MIRALPVFVLAWLAVLLVLAVSIATRGGVRPGDPRRYTPRSTHRGAGTRFDDARPGDTEAHAEGRVPDADAPTDFFTGAALDPDGAIVRCDDCRALYHPDTVAMLAEHNGGRCASCGGVALHPLGRRARRRDAAAGPQRARALVPEPSSREGYAAALGGLVTVEADVLRALPGPASGAPGLLIRDARGIELRLAFVGEAARGRRGRARALELLGVRVRARGLLLRDEAHGLKLLAIDPSMVRETVS
jgi:hypothetical protein